MSLTSELVLRCEEYRTDHFYRLLFSASPFSLTQYYWPHSARGIIGKEKTLTPTFRVWDDFEMIEEQPLSVGFVF